MREREKLIKTGHLEKINELGEDCFVSLVVITVESDQSLKIALDSRKLNDRSIKMRPHIPNLEELLNQISVEMTRDRTVQLFISKIHLDYAYGLLKLSEETSRQCVFAIPRENLADTTDSKMGFTISPIYPRYVNEKSTEHSDTVHQLG